MHKNAARRAVVLLALAVSTLLVAGCATEAQQPLKTSTPDAAAPLFASDEEALAAAEEAYAKYQAAFDIVSASGGVDVAGLDAVAHGQALERALQSAQDLVDATVTGPGVVTFATYKPQALSYSSRDTAVLRLYVCDDVSKADLVNASGQSLVLPGRPPLVPFEVAVSYVDGKGLVLTEKNFWTGSDFCAP